MEPYRTLNGYYRALFGQKTAKISIDAGFTCPNRDGTLGRGGCIFCSADGSGAFAEDAALSITEQIAQGRQQTADKWGNVTAFIAYFQAFTNTYAPVSVLREKYLEAIRQPGIVGLSIATRPDCLGEDVLDLLEEVSKETQLWVELGFQTANEGTGAFIKRGYDNQTFLDAVHQLHARQIPVVAHVILGLPHETREDMLQTIRFLNPLPIQGIKLHLMHVVRDTALACLYQNGDYTPMDKETYLSILVDCIATLREDIVIHRLTGDGDKKTLLAPLWSIQKRDVLNNFHRRLRESGLRQGENAGL